MKSAFSVFVLFVAVFSLHAAEKDAMCGPALRDVRLAKDGAPDIMAKACDYQSAADARLGDNFTWFSIWF